MSDLHTSVSSRALAATIPEVAMSEDTDYVDLRICYEAFAPETTEKHELAWRENTTLADYLDGLPPEAEWMVFHNGEEVELADAPTIAISREDRIGLILIPQGGDGFKNVLRIVMQAAAIALAFVPGIGWAAALAINIGIGLINAFLLTPKPPKNKGGDDSRSYGVDGAKNSATEGIPYPVVYGEFRTAGNFSDTYTENVGDDQYLYLRSVINDGEIEGVYDIEVNEQPVDNFKDVETRIAKGTLTQDVNDWFGRALRQSNKNMKLDTTFLRHITTQAVDKVRFDVMFSSGLVDIKEKDGSYRNRSVTFEMQCRKVSPVTGQPLTGWQDLPGANKSTLNPDLNGDGEISFSESLVHAARMSISAMAPSYNISSSSGVEGEYAGIQYREIGSMNSALMNSWSFNDDGGGWQNVGAFAPDQAIAAGYAFDPANDGTIAGSTNVRPTVNGEFEIVLPPGEYEFRGVGGAVITTVESFPTTSSAAVTVTDRRTRQIRKSFESARMEKGFYEVAIRRTSVTSTDQYKIDECYLTDIAEIEVEPVAMRGTANLSMRIKLNEQLNQIPGLTARVKGCILQEYDIEGNSTVRRWSANPAWVGLDILVGIERGAGMSRSRIDWPAWLELAAYCEANNVTFNGVFAEGTNIGDALNQVLRIGHAAPVPMGTRISVAIDRKRDPVTVFTQASMVEKTFQVTYMSMQDRANEYEVTYYDRVDRNKAKVLRYVDPKAVTFNEVPRSAGVSLAGCDNVDQAKVELWRMIYANRLLLRTITFDAWMEAINLTIGEVALIQHDMMEWASNGRLEAPNTTTQVELDQVVAYDGSPHAVLVHFDAVTRGTRTVHLVAGRKVLVTGASIKDLKVARLTNATGLDLEILKVEDGAQYHTITVAGDVSAITGGMQVSLVSTDALEERAVSSVATNANGRSVVTLATPLPAAPARYANFVFGKVARVKKPFVLTGLSGNGIEKRKLTFVEYHDGVYAAPEVEISIPTEVVNDRIVGHVGGLLFDYEQLVKANTKVVNARVHWNSGGTLNYAGADVYMALNGGPLRAVGTAVNVSEYHVQLSAGDRVQFQVIAFNTRGDRAPAPTAPGATGTISVIYADLDPPIEVAFATRTFEVNAKVGVSWRAPLDSTGIEQYEVQYRRSVELDTSYVALGNIRADSSTTFSAEVDGLPTGTYRGRVRAISATSTSVWVNVEFTVVVLPGSMLANWTTSNDRNGSAISAPALPATPVLHTLNRDGTANIEFGWIWAGDEASIDGFVVTVENTPPA